MKRREFMSLVGSAAAWPFAANAQRKIPRLAMADPVEKTNEMTSDSYRGYQVFFEELNRGGFKEGKTLIVDRYSASGRPSDYDDFVHHVVSTNPDVIFTRSILNTRFKRATQAIPIVMISGDPISSGLVTNIARPGGNITGVSIDAGHEIWGKRLSLLVEALPKISKVNLLTSRTFWEASAGTAVRKASQRMGIPVEAALVDCVIDEAEYIRAFQSMRAQEVGAFLIASDGASFTFRKVIVELATKFRLPAMYPYREQVELGGLMAYSTDLIEVFRRTANCIVQILDGTPPGNIPYFQQTKFDFAINLRTAKTLGLELPATLVARADEVIE